MGLIKINTDSTDESYDHAPANLKKNGGLNKNTFLLYDFFKVETPVIHFLKYKILLRGIGVFAIAWISMYLVLTIHFNNTAFIEPVALFLIVVNLVVFRATRHLNKYINGVTRLKEEIGDNTDYGFLGEKAEKFRELSDFINRNKSTKLKDSKDILNLITIPDFSPYKRVIQAIQDSCFFWACASGMVIGFRIIVSTIELSFNERIGFNLIFILLLSLLVCSKKRDFSGLLSNKKQLIEINKQVENNWLNEKNSV